MARSENIESEFLIVLYLSLQWPFVRFLGIQEPASVVFSILNLASHLYGFSVFYQKVPKDYPYLWIVCLGPLVRYIIVVVNDTCDVFMYVDCYQHLDMVSNFSHKRCHGNRGEL